MPSQAGVPEVVDGDGPPRVQSARARYQLYQGDELLFWRLLGGNNWCFGRSAATFTSLALAADAIRQVSEAAREGTFDINSEDGRAWTWTLQAGGVPLARSESRYGRRVECMASIKRFRAAAPEASIALQVRTVRNVHS